MSAPSPGLKPPKQETQTFLIGANRPATEKDRLSFSLNASTIKTVIKETARRFGYEISRYTADGVCKRESIDRIDLLKIDAQGYERQILEGAGGLLTPATIRGLLLEVAFVELYQNQTWCGEVMELLRVRGYRLFGFTGANSDDVHGWRWADAMFIGDV